MEYQKFTNLRDRTSDNVPRFIINKCVKVHEQSGSTEDRYKPSKQLRFKTPMLRSDLCGFSDVYIAVKGDITLTKGADREFIDVRNRFLVFKNNALFTNCISKINNVLKCRKSRCGNANVQFAEYSKITEKQHEVRRIITVMNLIILFLLVILQLLITMQTT